MPETLAVHLGREGRRSLEAPTSFEAEGSFEVALVNHGPGAHVYLQVDGELARVTGIDGDNYYVESESTRTVRVDVTASDDRVRGALSIATGYGAEDRTVAIDIQTSDRRQVEVDDSLATPESRPIDRSDSRLGQRLSPLLVGILAIVALALAVVAYVLTAGDVVVTIGAFVVVVAVLLAAAMVVR